jgi:prevent-host-death family protein
MPTTLNVNEAKANFSGMLAEVESGLVSFTIMRYGRPIARVVPVERTRKIRPIPGYGSKIAIKGDLFADDSSLWENA